jgi:lipid-binding SYLF domain-containing protein
LFFVRSLVPAFSSAAADTITLIQQHSFSRQVFVSLIPTSLRRLATEALSLADKEASALEELHGESRATVRRMAEEDPGLRERIDKAYAYAVFPSVGKATAVVGGAFGKGEVFRDGGLIGYAGVVQLTLGLQLGGETFSEIITFDDRRALERFKSGRTTFAASASAILVKAGAAAAARPDHGTTAFVSAEGGMMLEAAIGGQKFFFKPAVLGRMKSAPRVPKRSSIGKKRSSKDSAGQKQRTSTGGALRASANTRARAGSRRRQKVSSPTGSR